MIREVLAEELRRVKAERAPGAEPREERIEITSDADLAAFVQRLLALARDDRTRRDIEVGRLRFRLAGVDGRETSRTCAATPVERVEHLDQRFVSERQVDDLPVGVAKIVVGKSVRFTPLARDRLRQRNITIEREK